MGCIYFVRREEEFELIHADKKIERKAERKRNGKISYYFLIAVKTS
jgi:hypothetical protein